MTTIAELAPAPVLPDPDPPMTYLDLYGLSKPPFDGPRQGNGFILFDSQKRPFELLVGHLVNGSGVILLQGDEGVGKTEMLLAAGDVIAESGVNVVRMTRPPAGRTNLSRFVAALGGPDASTETAAEDAIRRFLSPPRKSLLVEDIDFMPEDCVRLLLSLIEAMPTDPGGPAIAVSSAPELGTETKRPDLAELAALARNTIRIPRLGPAEVQQYIERSLWVAGGTTRRLITPDALKTIITRSGGVAASVDRLMEVALTAGFARGDSMITGKTIASMSGGAPRRPRENLVRPEGVVALAIQIAAAVLLVSGASMFLYRAFDEPPSQPKSTAVVPHAAPSKAAVAMPPPPPSPSPKPAEAMAPDLMAALLKRGDQSLALGDTAAARLLFQHAADAGSAAAATALGTTYDPDYVALGEKPDSARAAEWYLKGVALGDARAVDRLKQLEAR